MSTTVIYEETAGNAVIKLRVEEKPNGPLLIETINGGVSNTLFIPERHRAAVAAALCPPAPCEVTEAARSPHPLALTCPCCQGDGWVRPDWTPEPSDAEIEAAAKALWESETHLMSWENLPENTHDRWNTLRQAKAALAAARAARQTGGDIQKP